MQVLTLGQNKALIPISPRRCSSKLLSAALTQNPSPNPLFRLVGPGKSQRTFSPALLHRAIPFAPLEHSNVLVDLRLLIDHSPPDSRINEHGFVALDHTALPLNRLWNQQRRCLTNQSIQARLHHLPTLVRRPRYRPRHRRPSNLFPNSSTLFHLQTVTSLSDIPTCHCPAFKPTLLGLSRRDMLSIKLSQVSRPLHAFAPNSPLLATRTVPIILDGFGRTPCRVA